MSELALVIAMVMAGVGLFSVQTERGKWAMAGGLILGLLAGLEITWREHRNHRRHRGR